MRTGEIGHSAPSLIPRHRGELIEEAEELVAYMYGVAPNAVGRIAEYLAALARSAGELEIAEAADAVHQEATCGGPITLTRPIQRLSAAIVTARALPPAPALPSAVSELTD